MEKIELSLELCEVIDEMSEVVCAMYEPLKKHMLGDFSMEVELSAKFFIDGKEVASPTISFEESRFKRLEEHFSSSVYINDEIYEAVVETLERYHSFNPNDLTGMILEISQIRVINYDC